MIQHCHVNPDNPTAVRRLVEILSVKGALTFDGPVDRAELLRLADHIMAIWPHRDCEPDGVTVLHDRGRFAQLAGYAGFGHDELLMHSESSAMERPPQLMMIYCARAAPAGGESRLVDGADLAEAIAAHDAELLEALSTPRSVLFGGASGYLGEVFSAKGQRTRVRLRLDALAQFSPQITSRLPELRTILADMAVPVHLTPGSGYLLSNTRWLHGRASFTGERVMYRLLGDPLPGVVIPPGFPAVGSAW